MGKVLILPTVLETPLDNDDWYLVRLKLDRGISLIQREDGSYYWQRFASLDELIDAEKYWLGGHEYPLTDQEATDLINAGFGQYIHDYTPPGSYGWGVYGGGDYGYGGEYV